MPTPARFIMDLCSMNSSCLGPSSYSRHSVGTVEIIVNESLLWRQLMNQMALRGVGEAGHGRTHQWRKMPWRKRGRYMSSSFRAKGDALGPEMYLQSCIFNLMPLMLGLHHSRFSISPGLRQQEFFVSNALKTIKSSYFYPFCSTKVYWLTGQLIYIVQTLQCT